MSDESACLCQNGYMDTEEIQDRFVKAVQMFMGDQHQLLELDANERAIGATLAHVFMREMFPYHRVDAEYNRVGLDGSAKRLNLPLECGGDNARVFPDIVVHRRGDNQENILAVEIKLTSNKQPRHCDLIKLEAFREQLRYRVGVFLELPAGKDFGRMDAMMRWFV